MSYSETLLLRSPRPPRPKGGAMGSFTFRILPAVLVTAFALFTTGCETGAGGIVDTIAGSEPSPVAAVTTITTTSSSPTPEPSPSPSISILSGSAQTAIVSNAFSLPLKVLVSRSGAVLVGVPINFAVLSGVGGTLSASSATTDASGIAQVTFTAGMFVGTTIVRASYLGSSADFSFNIVAPDISLSVPSYDFGELNVNGTRSIAIQVTNLSDTSAVAINSLNMSGDSGFSLGHNCPTSLAASGTCTATVTFVPASAGAKTGSLLVSYGAGLSKSLSISGTGNSVVTSLAAVSGNSQSTQILTAFTLPLKVQLVENGAPRPNSVINFTVQSGSSGTFSSTTATTDSSGYAQVTYTASGTAGATTIRASYNGTTADFSLTATNPDIAFSVPDYAFGSRTIGTSNDTSVVISNLSNANSVTVYSVSMSGDSSFSVTNNCGGLIVASGACTATVTFAPTTSGSKTASLIVGFAPGLSESISITGIGASNSPTVTVVGGNLQTGAPSTTFTDALRVQVLSSAGAPVVGATVSFAVNAGATGTFTAATAVTDASGMASTSFIAGATAGSSTIRASYSGVTADFTETIIDQSGTTIAIVSGNTQSANIGTTLSQSLVVQVIRTATGLGASNVLVRFNVTSGNGRINGASNTLNVSTDAGGLASVNFDVGTQGTGNLVTATIVSVPAQVVTFSETGVVPAGSTVSLSQSVVSVSPTSSTADGSSVVTLTMTAKDAYGNQIPAGGATVVLTATAGTLLGSVTDNSNGTYTRTLRMPATLAVNPISLSATVGGAALTSAAASLPLVAGSISLAQSAITTASNPITADGSATTLVTVTLKDALGNQITTGGQTVVLATTSGTLVGSVTDNNDGTYTQTIRAPTVSGTAVLSATVGGAALTNTTNLTLAPGSPSVVTSSISVSPSAILPNGTSTSIITMIIRDDYSNRLTGSGGVGTLTTNAGTWSGAIVDNADGSYQRVLVSAVTSGTATISGTIAGATLNSTARVYFTTGSTGPNISTSTVTLLTGSAVVAADGSTQRTIRVTLKDGANAQMSAGGSTVAVATTAGTLVGSIVDNGNGTYDQVVQAPASAAIATVSATVDGSTITSTTTLTYYGAFSLATSTITPAQSAIEATGATNTLIVIQAKDSLGTSIPVGGATGLVLATTQGTLLTSLVDNSNGTYTQSLQSTNTGQTATVSATKTGAALSATATVQFFVANNLAGATITCANVVATYKNTNILVDGGTLTMNSTDGTSADCSSDFVFTSITLRNTATLTHTATTTLQEYGMDFTTPSLSIDATSKIDVSGKGYPGHSTLSKFYVPGASSPSVPQLVAEGRGGTTACRAGGSHGGEGGSNTASNFSSKTYGSLFQPKDMGGSGGVGTGAGTSTAGGGRVKITLSGAGSITVDGSIKANGSTATATTAGAGAGGSVWISAPTGTIKGTGTISANGANGLEGGGGGRVAIYYSAMQNNFALNTSVITNVTAYGGTGSTGANADGAAGTIYLKGASQTYGDLIINNLSRTNSNIARTWLNVPASAVPDGVTATTLTKASYFADNYSTVKSPYVGYYINPKITQNATSTLSDDVVFQVTSAVPNTLTTSTGNMTAIASPGDTAQLYLVFDNLELIGKASISGTAPILINSGDLSSGNTTTAAVAGAFSQPIDFAGATNLTVDGATTYGTTTLPFISTTGTVTLKNGTFAVDKITANTLSLDAANVTAGQLKGTNAITLSGQMTMTNTSTLTQIATTASAEYSLEISAAGLNLAAASSITALGKGYSCPTTSGKFRSYGNLDATAINAQTTVAAAGSHGGRGIAGTTNDTNATYGSIHNPNESGASGQFVTGQSCAPGGGLIRINLSGGPATINGTVDASGSAIYIASGAGGSVYINAGAIDGNGTIKANGGAGISGGYGGGGGRIALYYTSTSGGFAYPGSILSRFQNYGGASSGGSRSGTAGTTYLKASSQTYGDLYIDNASQSNVAATTTTYINIPTSATSTTLDTTTVTRANYFSEYSTVTNNLVGYYLNPNTAQNGTATLNDDTMYKITSQTANTVVTAGNLSATGSTGNTFSVVLVLDNLQVSGGATLDASGSILVKKGDITSGDDTTVTETGALLGTGCLVEFAGANAVTLNANGSTMKLGVLTAATTVSLTNGTFTLPSIVASGAVSLGTGTYTINTISAASLSMDTATLTAGAVVGSTAINLTGALTLTNTSSITQIATTLTTEYSLEITAGSMDLSSNSTLSALGKGYVTSGTNLKFRSYGNVDVGAINGQTANRAGGSHGGRGGGTSTLDADATYGSLFNPYESGSSGFTVSATNGTTGGGIVRINLAAGAAVINGTIDASAPTSGLHGGAGGSVYVYAGAVSGSGTLKANGTPSTNGYASGGGGRIALYYASASGGFAYPASILSRFQNYGGVNTTANQTGAAGTTFLKNTSTQTYGDLYIDNNNQANGAVNSTYINIPSSTTSTTVSSTTLTKSSYFGEAGYNTNHLVGFYLHPNTAQNATATVNDDTMYAITSQTLNTLVTAGTLTNTGADGNNFKVVLVLDNLEFKNAARLESSGQILVKYGDITSNTTNTATISAEQVGTTGPEFVGLSALTLNAQASTFYMPDLITTGAVTLSSGTFTIPKVSVGSLTVGSSATLVVGSGGSADLSPNITATGNVTVSSSSVIKPRTTTSTTEYRVYISAASLTVDSSSSVTADNLGYPATTASRFRSVGNIDYLNKAGSASVTAGASHGGMGGRTAAHGNNDVYGNFKTPTDLGTSGASGSTTAGGGAIRIVTSGTVSVDGTITASATTSSAQAASGGSVYITAATLAGTGTIKANGAPSSATGAGGGGRIAIYADTFSNTFAYPTIYTYVNAFGGAGTPSATPANNGGAGTIFIKTAAQNYGDLIINNNSIAGDATGVTLLKIPTTTVSTAISGAVLTTSSAFTNQYSQLDQLIGYFLNPQTTQTATSKLSDDTFLRIASNTASAITIDGTTAGGGVITGTATVSPGSTGDTYKVGLILDNLEVRGKATLDFGSSGNNGSIYVLSGDVSSNNSTSFSLDGTLNANVVDVGPAVTWSNTANGVITGITQKCAANGGAYSCP